MLRDLISCFFALALCMGCQQKDAEPPLDTGPPCDAHYPAGQRAVVRGHVMPNMSFESLDGEVFDLEELRGCGDDKILVLEPFPLWCLGCREAIPFLEDLHSQFGAKGLRVVIAVGEDLSHEPATAPVVSEWMSQFAPTLEGWLDPEGRLQAYTSFSTLPMTLVIDLETMNILLKLVGGENREVAIDLIAKLLDAND